MRKTLEEMRWPQPNSPIQTDSSTTAVVVNNTIVPSKLKTTDHSLHWLRCREVQGQFRYYWAIDNFNWGVAALNITPPLSRSENNAIFWTSSDHLRHLVPIGSSKDVFSRLQVERTSTWNHNTPSLPARKRLKPPLE